MAFTMPTYQNSFQMPVYQAPGASPIDMSGWQNSESQILGGYQNEYTQAMGELGTLSDQQNQDLQNYWAGQTSQAIQGMSPGLRGSTVAPSMRMGFARAESAAQQNLLDQQTREKLGYQTQLQSQMLGAQQQMGEAGMQYGIEGQQLSMQQAQMQNMFNESAAGLGLQSQQAQNQFALSSAGLGLQNTAQQNQYSLGQGSLGIQQQYANVAAMGAQRQQLGGGYQSPTPEDVNPGSAAWMQSQPWYASAQSAFGF